MCICFFKQHPCREGGEKEANVETFCFLRNLHVILHSGYTNLQSHQQLWRKGTLSSITSPTFIVCRLSDDHHSDWYEVISHCSFDIE